MSYADTRSCFEQLFSTHWTYTPIFWTNSPFDPPQDGNRNAEPYVAVTVREGSSEEITLGSENPWYRHSGIVIVQIFTLERTGSGLADGYADMVKGIFKRVAVLNGKTDITTLALDDSFNSLTTDFITQGFVAGLSFTASGSIHSENSGLCTIVSVTQRKLAVLSKPLVDESVGVALSFHAVKTFNYRNSGLIRPRIATIIPVGLVSGWYQTNVTIPYTRDAQA
jgi:hypothetical protein